MGSFCLDNCYGDSILSDLGNGKGPLAPISWVWRVYFYNTLLARYINGVVVINYTIMCQSSMMYGRFVMKEDIAFIMNFGFYSYLMNKISGQLCSRIVDSSANFLTISAK